MDEERSIGTQAPYTCLFFVIGAGYGYFLWIYSLAVTGGGHGNNAAILVLPGAVFVPVLGIGWGFYRTRLADVIVAPMVIHAGLLDFLFFVGFDGDLFKRAPGTVTIWYALWIGWQIPLFGLLIVRIVRSLRR